MLSCALTSSQSHVRATLTKWARPERWEALLGRMPAQRRPLSRLCARPFKETQRAREAPEERLSSPGCASLAGSLASIALSFGVLQRSDDLRSGANRCDLCRHWLANKTSNTLCADTRPAAVNQPPELMHLPRGGDKFVARLMSACARVAPRRVQVLCDSSSNSKPNSCT